MNSTSTIDKYIKLSWQIVQNDVVLACGLTVIMMVMGAGVGIIGSLLLLPVGFLLLFNAARKLFYTSLYGQGATMYQTLPVKPEEIVSLRGYGRFLFKEEYGTTNKGRIKIRYQIYE